MRISLSFLALALLTSACAAPPAQPAPAAPADDPAAHRAHEAYVAAIKSNNLDTLRGTLTDDVVDMSPHEPVMAGKAAVRP